MSLRFRNCPRIFPNRKRCFEGKCSIFVLARRVILLSREVLIDASQRENAWRTRESGLLPVPKTFEPRTGAQPDRFAALPNPGIHSPIPPEIEPDVLTDMCRLRIAQGGLQADACVRFRPGASVDPLHAHGCGVFGGVRCALPCDIVAVTVGLASVSCMML